MNKKESPVVPVIASLVVMLCVGIIYLWSVFRSPIQATFGMQTGAVTMVSSVMLFGFVFGTLIGGFVNDKKGPRFAALCGVILFALGVGLTGLLNENNSRLIYLTYCIMGGLGSGFAYSACLSCIQKWLPHRRGFASGIACAAFGLSTVIFAPVSNSLMNAHKVGTAVVGSTETILVDFRAVFFTMAIIFAVIGLIACALIRLPKTQPAAAAPQAAAAPAASVPSLRLGQALRTGFFWCLFFDMFLINGTWNLCTPIIKTLGVERGLTPAMAIFAVSFTGIANALGRLAVGALSDKMGRTNAIILMAVLTILGAVGMTFIGGPAYIVVVAIIAFAYGGPAPLHAAMTTDFFGPKHFGLNYGCIMLALGLSSLFFNWISTSFLHSNPTPTFVMGAITAVVPIILMLLIKRMEKKRDAAAAQSQA
ncbi:MAG: MFS transporter [Oscillospiraceae bacterium]|nr:MFS transporter [Oscillospiraceae bacterium]